MTDHYAIDHLHDPPKFLADENVKGLARWLRFLGYDTEIAQGSDEIVRVETRRSGRCLVTRDAELASLLRNHAILVKSDRVEDQLKTVLKNAPHAPPGSLVSRCVECNDVLNELEPQEADRQDWKCPHCGHSFWEGRHSSLSSPALEPLNPRR